MLSKLDQVSQDILGVADYIEEKGWCQCSFENIDGSMCLSGAISRYLHRIAGVEWGDVLAERARAIKARLNLDMEIISWNDTPGRTKEQVLKKLRNAAC